MDLFVVNRYLGDDRIVEAKSTEERDRLAQLLLKIEDKRRQKEELETETESGQIKQIRTPKAVASTEITEKSDYSNVTPKTQSKKYLKNEDSETTLKDNAFTILPVKKERKHEVFEYFQSDQTILRTPSESKKRKDISNIPTSKKTKKRKHVVCENSSETVGDGALDGTASPDVPVAKWKGRKSEILEDGVPAVEGFTVLGLDQFKKKAKVKRVLPYWLANPSVVSVNLQELNTTVDDVCGLDGDLVQRLKDNNIHYLFPVQSQVIPWLLAAHRKPIQYWPCDVCVSAPTGSGKTLAFVVPIIQTLMQRVVPQIRALVVLPVQDLAVQVFKVFQKYCVGTDLKVALITGQNSFHKEQQLLVKTSAIGGAYCSLDIIVTTPGRLVDHIQCTPGFSLKYLRFLVIDEADRVMESVQNEWLYHVDKHINAGTRPFLTVSSLQTASPPPQKLLFSATLSQDPEKLQQLGLFQPKLFTSVVGEQIEKNVTVTTDGTIRGDFVGKYTTPAELSEKFCLVGTSSKPLVLYHLITSNQWKHVLCFANSQQAAHRLALLLTHLGQGQLRVAEISSTLKRHNRDHILQQFSIGELDILVSSDTLARGMDILGVDYVISYDSPKYVKTYIHRIGRTGRAGREGTAVTLVLKNQNNHFQQMLHTAGKISVTEVTVSEMELEPLEEQYKLALGALKHDLLEEKKEILRKLQAMKKYSKLGVHAEIVLKKKLTEKKKKKFRTEISK